MTTLDRRDNRKLQVQAIDIAGRVPPHNTDAEEAVLAAVLLDGRVLDEVDFLAAEDFYSEAHKRVFEAVREVRSKGTAVDIQTVAAWLRDRDWLQAVGGVSSLAKLVDATPAVAHIEAHAQIVKGKSRVRAMIAVCQQSAAEAYGDYGDAAEYINSVERRVCEVGVATHVSNETDARTLMGEEFDRIKRLRASDGPDPDVMPTGLVDVDDVLAGGHRRGELIVIAGRPGMGKTAYVIGQLLASAQRDTAVELFSLEMPKAQMSTRLLAHLARVDVRDIRKANFGPVDWDSMLRAGNDIAVMPIWIDDTGSATLAHVRAVSRRRDVELRRRGKRLGLVIVDYLQLMAGTGEERNREEVIATISRGLKALAKELGIPVIALSQLNRSVETRPGKDKRPQLSDLRESGAIEQDADVIQFLYRPEYYYANKNTEEARKVKGYAEIIIAKQRNGPTKMVPVTFLEEFAAFVSRERGMPSPDWED